MKKAKLHIEKGGKVRLVQVQLLGNGYTLLNDIGAECEEGARFEILQLFLGGEKTYSGCLADLKGRESCFKADIGYQGKGCQCYDYTQQNTAGNSHSSSELSDPLLFDFFSLSFSPFFCLFKFIHRSLLLLFSY